MTALTLAWGLVALGTWSGEVQANDPVWGNWGAGAWDATETYDYCATGTEAEASASAADLAVTATAQATEPDVLTESQSMGEAWAWNSLSRVCSWVGEAPGERPPAQASVMMIRVAWAASARISRGANWEPWVYEYEGSVDSEVGEGQQPWREKQQQAGVQLPLRLGNGQTNSVSGGSLVTLTFPAVPGYDCVGQITLRAKVRAERIGFSGYQRWNCCDIVATASESVSSVQDPDSGG